MIKYGASILSWIPAWTPEGGLHAIQKTAACGFDLLEVLLPATLDFDAKTVKRQLAGHGLEGRCTFILPTDCHLPSHPAKATFILKAALDKVEAMEGDFLGGVLHSAIGSFTGSPCTAAELQVVADVLGEVAAYARPKGITVALEPINRYESYVLTSAAEVVNLIQGMRLDNLALHLDTFHMNIEENSFYSPVVLAGELLQHVHMTESDRGMLSEGNVQWDDLFRGLREINYAGPLVLENFSSHIEELVGPTSLWRPSRYNPEDLATGSLEFMRQMAEKWGLQKEPRLEASLR